MGLEQISSELINLLILMLLGGMAAGFLAGLFGVGGGLILVPLLDWTFLRLDLDPEISIDMAVATSLASIVFTGLASSRAHYLHGNVDLPILRAWGPTIALGAVLGFVLVKLLGGNVGRLIFALAALLIACWLLLAPQNARLGDSPPRGIWGRLWAGFIGLASALIGIGGGSLSVPTLTLYGFVTQRATGTSAVFGLCIALPAALTAIFLGQNWNANGGAELARPPLSLGDVSLLALLTLVPLSVLIAPLGARAGQALSSLRLRQAFGGFMILVALRMLYATL